MVFDFEKPLAGWDAEGDAFAESPTTTHPRIQPQIHGAVAGARQLVFPGSATRRQARSRRRPFVIDRPTMGLRVGGGWTQRTRVELLVDGKVERKATGIFEETGTLHQDGVGRAAPPRERGPPHRRRGHGGLGAPAVRPRGALFEIPACRRSMSIPSSRLGSWLLPAAVSLSVASFETATRACAVCPSGAPPAAPVAGLSGGALVLGLDARAGGASVTGHRVDERRLELLASYDFLARYSVDVGLPGLWRTVSSGGSAAEVVSLGDLETRLRYLAWRRHEASMSIFAGAKWPTAPVATLDSGAPLPSALQPGCSSIAPFVGAFATWMSERWTLTGTGQVSCPSRCATPLTPVIRSAWPGRRSASCRAGCRRALRCRSAWRPAAPCPKTPPTPTPAGPSSTWGQRSCSGLRRASAWWACSFPVVQGWFGQRRETPVVALSLLVRP